MTGSMGRENTIGSGSTTAAPATRGHGKLPELAAAAIRDMILADELSPGERVPEHALARQHGISRTPLREALKLVAAEGLLELAPNRGAVVANPGPGEIRDMVAVMAVLDAMGVLGLDQPFVHESLIGTRFTGTIRRRVSVGDLEAIVPEIQGSAWITVEHVFLVDDDDPLREGFLL